MKYIILGTVALFMLGGCASKPQPQHQPKPTVEEAPQPVYDAPPKRKEVPPLPEREVDLDMDSMVDEAMSESLNDDNNAQKMP